ncbi:MAG: hypothetical protein SVR08_16410, partial [Spirochaetota bacterium]|nr:hypothetical protein [Spirochaetota bacterium]
MIIANLKPIEEIMEMIKGSKKVLNVGCAGCTAICLAGGQKEVDSLNVNLRSLFKNENVDIQIDGYTVERQCETDFIAELDKMVDKY